MKTHINSLTKITKQHLKSLSAKETAWSKNEAYIYRDEKADKIVFHFGQHKSSTQTTLEDMIETYEKYLNGGKYVSIKLGHKVRQKNIINALVSDKPTDTLLKKALNSLVLDYQVPSHLEIFEYLVDTEDKYAKKILLQIFEKMGEKTSHNSADPTLLQNHISLIQNFEFGPEEYTHVHNFLSYHQKIIDNKNHQIEFHVVEFLKHSIPAQDWIDFARYCHKDKGLRIRENDKPLLEENNKEVYNLILNPSYIKKHYPALCSDSNLGDSITKILDTFTRNGADINVENGFTSFIGADSIKIHFMADSQEKLDTRKIQKMFTIILDKYAQIPLGQWIYDKDMDDIYKYAFIASALEEKPATKSLKI